MVFVRLRIYHDLMNLQRPITLGQILVEHSCIPHECGRETTQIWNRMKAFVDDTWGEQSGCSLHEYESHKACHEEGSTDFQSVVLVMPHPSFPCGPPNQPFCQSTPFQRKKHN